LSWRWYFYINLPIGAFTIFAIALILHVPSTSSTKLPLRKQLAQLDLLGIACFLSCIVSLILALQWGGSTYACDDRRIVALLVVFGALLVAFIGVQFWKGDAGTVPPRITRQRSIAFGAFYSTCAAGSMFIIIYYLPIWFQAIKNVDAVESGIMTLPTVISLVLSSVLSGAITACIGYYTPAMITAPIFMSIGAGLITTFMPDTGHENLIGYQVLYGLGLGGAIQAPSLAAQAVLSKEDISIGMSHIMFSQQLGNAIFVSVGQNVFTTRLVSGLEGIPGLAPSTVVNLGATDLTSAIAPQFLEDVLSAYNYALTKTFDVNLAMSCVMIIGALGMEWKSIKKAKKGGSEP
jgi:Fungal trichothecene efflux pump (TRI12)